MNNSPSILHPESPVQIGGGSPVQIVAIKTALLLPVPMYPPQNSIGRFLLAELCQRALAARSLLTPNHFQSGELNDAWLIFAVNGSSPGPALDVLDEVLRAVPIRPMATLLYYDPHGGFFRPHGPDHANIGPRFTLEAAQDQTLKDGALINAAAGWLQSLIRQVPPSPAPEPPPDCPESKP